tara:strand:- start:262 stop:564 length:303 start_codon:yes stop_codon:yes gene_type:complete
MITKFTAIHALVGGQISGPANGPISEYKFRDEQTPPTEEQIQAKLDELKADEEATQYQRDRAPLYPPIGDQLDDLYKKGAFSEEMAAKIKKVKDDNPKPS